MPRKSDLTSDALLLAQAVLRNMPELRKALRETGRPDSWLTGVAAKCQRIIGMGEPNTDDND